VEDEQSLEDSKFVRAAMITPQRASTCRASAPRRTMRGICSAFPNRELTMRQASASRANSVIRGICFALSNRELQLLEPPVRPRKQTKPTLSNRELSTNRCRNDSRTPLLLLRQIYNWSRRLLTGSASQTECDVTRSKQTTERFLTGARTHIRVFRFSPFSIARKPRNQIPHPQNTPPHRELEFCAPQCYLVVSDTSPRYQAFPARAAKR
jgi:hypothetical protein